MMSKRLHAVPGTAHRTLALVLALGLALILAACGGGGYTPPAVSQTERRALSTDFLTRTAVNYSPFRTSASEADLVNEVIPPANVLQDLRLVQASGIGTIRLFSSRAFARTVLEVIRDNGLDLKVQLGAYPNPINSAADEADNVAELDACIALATRYSDIVLAVSVGNETMVEWSTHKVPVADMARYIKYVRDRITQPVTTNDNWLFWASVPTAIAETVDFAAVHVYPFLDTFYNPTAYDWRQRDVPEGERAQAMIDATVVEARSQFERARKGLTSLNLGTMPMTIGETGWAAVDTSGGPDLSFRAHPVNQKLYFEALQLWAQDGRRDRQGPKAIFYFQAFDEPWKQGDDGWGLFTRDRKARCVVQDLNPPSASWVYDTSVSCDLADAVYFDPPIPTDPLDAAISRLVLFSDAPVLPGDLVATGRTFNPFAATSAPLTSATFADGSESIAISPNPANFGWGFFQVGPAVNMTGFVNGHVNLWIRTNNYPGRIEIGIWSDTEDRTQAEAYVAIAAGDYGYCTNDTWCQVSIPVAAFLAANPAIDLRFITAGFVISDVFERTGKPLNTTGLPLVYVDGITWTR